MVTPRQQRIFETNVKMFKDAGCPTLETEWLPARSKWRYTCLCGKEKLITPGNFKKGKRCKECSTLRTANKRKHSYSYVKNYFESVGCKLISESYKNNHTPLIYLCRCGREGKTAFNHFLKSKQCAECSKDDRSGVNHYKWNPNYNKEQRELSRKTVEYNDWRQFVFKRDNYTCNKCCKKGGELNAHHIFPFHKYPKRRLLVGNGITLCKECHTAFHKKYSHKDIGMIETLEYINS